MRESNEDSSFQSALGRLKELKAVKKEVSWHRGCYSSFTNQGHILCLQKRTSDDSEGYTKQPATPRRSLEAPIDWSKCIQESHGFNKVPTMEMSAKIIQKATCHPVMNSRRDGVTDLIAAEGKYHLKCYTKFQRSVEITQDVNT